MSVSISTTYKFTLYDNPYIGQQQIGKLVSICDYQTAMTILDVNQLHLNLYPYLPVGTPKNPAILEYYVIHISSSEKIVLSPLWLNTPPEIITSIKQQYVMEFNTNTDRIAFEALMSDYGYNPISSIEI